MDRMIKSNDISLKVLESRNHPVQKDVLNVSRGNQLAPYTCPVTALYTTTPPLNHSRTCSHMFTQVKKKKSPHISPNVVTDGQYTWKTTDYHTDGTASSMESGSGKCDTL